MPPPAKITADFDNNQPIYLQIIDRILLAIAKGELPPGSKVSPVRELAADFKVNPNTMQKSLSKLEEEGVLYTERTSGRYVTSDTALIETIKKALPHKATAAYIAQMQEYGIALSLIPTYVQGHIEAKEAQSGS